MTDIAAEETPIPTMTHSIPLDDLTLSELVLVSQRLGAQVDELRRQRAYLRGKIEQRLAAGERTSTDPA